MMTPFSFSFFRFRIEMTNSSLLYSNSWVEPSPTPLSTPSAAGIPCGSPACAPAFSYGDVNAGGLSLLRLLLVRLRARLLPGAPATPSSERSQAGVTNLISLGSKTYAVTEVVLPYEVELRETQQQKAVVVPRGFSDLDGLLGAEYNSPDWTGPEEAPMSAHPRTDPRTGETFFFSANHGPGARPIINFVRIPRRGNDGNQTRLQIPVLGKAAAFYHDMFLTENYAVVVHSSLRRDPSRLLSGQSINYFDASEPLYFGIIPRSATSADQMVWIAAPRSGHIWHTVTAREEGNDTLVLYAPKYDSYADVVNIHLETEEPSFLTRFVIHLSTGACTETRIFDEVVERPTVHPNRIEHRYAYLRSEGTESHETGRRIVKFDLHGERPVGSFQCGEAGSDCLFGEALFVPRIGEAGDEVLAEDDGYLMDIVYAAETHSSMFSVWSAASMDERPLVSASLPQRVPHGAHGAWFM
jgi:carotenoid cleavage dioxygenase-like enzyme